MDKVTVAAESGETFEGDRVIVTVPLPILQQDLIAFSPALPEDKTQALGRGCASWHQGIHGVF